MKTIAQLIALAVALFAWCGCTAQVTGLADRSDPAHSAYTCTASLGVDAGACIQDFRTGAGSDCMFLCDQGVCELQDVVNNAYRSVATCVAPGVVVQDAGGPAAQDAGPDTGSCSLTPGARYCPGAIAYWCWGTATLGCPRRDQWDGGSVQAWAECCP